VGGSEAVDDCGDCEAEGIELRGLVGFIDGRGIGVVLRFEGGGSGCFWREGVVPGLGVVRDGRGRRSAEAPSILLRLAGEMVLFLRFEVQ
jgi:hypothetical protein